MKRLLPYLLLLAEVLLFYRYTLFQPGRYVFPWDLRGFHLPQAYFYADSLARHELPFWDPYTYCGRPFQANIQTAVFYPTVPIAVQFGLYGLELNVAFHVFLAGVFAFLLARSLGLRPASAFLAATVYQLCGFFAAHVEHMGAITIAAWLPAAWLCVVRGRWIWLSAVFAMAILGGLTPLTALVFATSLLLAILFVVVDRASWRIPLAVAGAIGASLLLTAVQLVPTLQLTSHSIAQYRADWLKSGGGVPLQALVSLVWPNYYDIFDLSKYHQPFELTFMYLYCGWIGLGLAVLGVVWRRPPTVRSSLIIAVLALLSGWVMLGDSTWLWRAFYSVLPLSIRIGLHPEYSIPAFTLCIAVLAGFGLERLNLSARTTWAVGAVAAAELIIVSSGRPMNAFKLADEPGVSRTSFNGNTSVVSTARNLTRQSVPPSRIDTINDAMEWAMAAPTMQIYTANGNDPMALARLIQARLAFVKGERWGAYYQVSNLASPVLGLMDIRYLLSRTEAQTSGTPFIQAATIPGSIVYQNQSVLPRFFLVSKIKTANSYDDAIRLFHSPDFAPAEEAVVEGHVAVSRTGGPGQVRVIRYQPRLVELGITAPAARLLVTSETHYPGWRAYVDGREQQILYTDLAFRGVAIPAGNHRVEMRFQPTLFWWSALVSATAWLCWLGAVYVLR